MARNSERNLTRTRIAHLAARLMAQDGIEDYGQAKRKAARQAGVAETRQLPTNDEIDAALKEYRALFQQEHAGQLHELRRLALEVMEQFSEFNLQLTGPVLTGSAGRYAAVHFQLYTDNGKAAELNLINRGIDFSRDEQRLYEGGVLLNAPVIVFEYQGVEVRITLLSLNNQRAQLKTSPDGKAVARAGRDALAALLSARISQLP